MDRKVRTEFPACPIHYSPASILPKEFLRHAWSNGWVRAFRDLVLPLKDLISEHKMAVVVAGVDFEFLGGVHYEESDRFYIDTNIGLYNDGALIKSSSEFILPNKESPFLKISITTRPVFLGCEKSMAAEPRNLPDGAIAEFKKEEIFNTRLARKIPAILESLEKAECLGEYKHPFRLYRYACDVADQWAYAESYGYLSASREEMLLSGELKISPSEILSAPLKKMVMEFRKPYFLFDEGIVHTTAFLKDDEYIFVHNLTSAHDQKDVHSTTIEFFPRSSPA